MRLWAIDTNVVVSGLLQPLGPSARVLDALADGRIKLVYDVRILTEYRDVLSRPRFKLAPARIAAFLNALGGQVLVTSRRLHVIGPDSDDIIFIEAALMTPDRTIVTGNLAHFPPEILHGVRVITPVQAAAEAG